MKLDTECGTGYPGDTLSLRSKLFANCGTLGIGCNPTVWEAAHSDGEDEVYGVEPRDFEVSTDHWDPEITGDKYCELTVTSKGAMLLDKELDDAGVGELNESGVDGVAGI